MAEKQYSGTQAVQRAIQLLKLFDDDHAEWSLVDLYEAAGLNKTTAFRLLNALEVEGLIQKTPSGSYRLGPESIALGGRAMRANRLRVVSREALETLARETGETVTLEILRPDYDGHWSMLVIDEVVSQHLIGITQYIGSRLPIHATSTGKAVLAFQSEARQAEILAQPLPYLTEQTVISPDEFKAELERIRSQGFATAMGELERGVMAASAPIFNHEGSVLAAMSLVGPSIRVNEERLLYFAGRVKETADAVSYQMGFRGNGSTWT